jgi:hypothetical protein
MKKIIMIIAGAFCLSAFAVEAQAQDGPKKDTTSIQPSPSYRDDMVKITADDLPEAVKSTLQGAQYKGWDTGNIFRNPTGDEYVVEITGDDRQVKKYKFDSNGRPIEEKE